MKISKFFEEILKAPLANNRWSWGAVRPNSNQVFLRVWEDQIDKSVRPNRVSVLRGNWKTSRAGHMERERHVAALQNGATGYGVACTAVDRVASKRKIASFDEKYLVKFGRVVEQDGDLSAEIVGRVAVADVTLGDTKSDAILSDIEAVLASNIDKTTKRTLVDARIGQGKFRNDVLSLWGLRCCVTGSQVLDAVRASHIKPWKQSTNAERLDPNNGLPLIATLDALFDAGLVSFDDDGNLRISRRMSADEQKVLGLAKLRLCRRPNDQVRSYLAYHRTRVFADRTVAAVHSARPSRIRRVKVKA